MAGIISRGLTRAMSSNAGTSAATKKPWVPVPHPFADKHTPSAGTGKLWNYLCYFVAYPAVILMSIKVYLHESDPTNHVERPPFIPYEYLCIRKKPFPWGDGNHSLFHNPHRNALPDGYEDEH